VVTPIGRVCDGGNDWTIGDGAPGPVTLELRDALIDLQHGRVPDPHGWLYPTG
jgi:branched-chain amino acid aminotransferase